LVAPFAAPDGPGGETKSKLLYEIVAENGWRHHKSVR